ncbi:hypothetical protein LSH36_236g01030 [Paralvinella palmiformis]|uniref:Selenoprotein F/M domain-containing protein n=1 Tax=Paralvinella palmiformis TaxID=53620 RepID=A0AAD9N4X2_9ANNE|nr:hypothetical protein LSH36_236g01030 [Paralvinella palmiformis]
MSWKVVLLLLSAIPFLVVGLKGDEAASEKDEKAIVRALVEFVKNPGASPVLMLKNADGENVETINLQDYNRQQCNDLLLNRGFYKKANPNDDVPEEFQNAPYKRIEREEL